MTTIYPKECTCFMCKTKNTFHKLSSTNSFGSPDLDLRKPPMQRYTMEYWLEECPSCHYVAPSIEEPTKLRKDFIKSESYTNCSGIDFKSELAQRFYRRYLIDAELGEFGNACNDAIHAAWACDDEGDTENAKTCRILAASLTKSLIRKDNEPTILLMRADLLRRAEQFEQLLKEYSNLQPFNDDLLDKILAFQIKKAKEKDTKGYTVEQAINSEKE